jgi:drug/metabolite transporter (DMT)-like permease
VTKAEPPVRPEPAAAESRRRTAEPGQAAAGPVRSADPPTDPPTDPPVGRTDRRWTPPVAVAFASLCLIWGSTYLAIKIGIEHWPPVLLASVRNAVACVAVALVLAAGALIWRRSSAVPGLRRWWPPAIFAVLQGTAFGLIFWAERYISSGQTAVLVSMNPIFTLPLARLWLGERIRRHHYLAVLVGFAGVVVATTVRTGAGFEGSTTMRVVAQAAVLGAAFCYAFSLLFSRKYMSGDKYVNTAIHLGTSAAYLFLLSLLMDPPDAAISLDVSGILAMLYLAIPGSAVAYWVLFYLIENLGPVEVSYVTVVNPVVAVLLGVAVLGEPLTATVVAGTAAVAAGVYLVNRPAKSS